MHYLIKFTTSLILNHMIQIILPNSILADVELRLLPNLQCLDRNANL